MPKRDFIAYLLRLLLCIHFCHALHPMLYFNSNELAKLRHKTKTTHSKIAKIIEEAGRSLKEDPDFYLPPKSFEKFGSRWNEIYGNNLCAFAMYCALYPNDEKAMSLVKIYMDRMTSYPDWYVTSSRNVDEVPVAHSLTGYATAFDFLYNRFPEKARKQYLKKIGSETFHLYDLIDRKRGGWTRQHIHNHAPTNLLATLIGAMVYEVHYPNEALLWKKACIDLFEKAMLLLSYVIDGSCDEGVAYGSYSSRGITQYVFLALRHLNKDHTNNPWLRQHFWFYYATAMPGYQRSVGIADSNHNWFYGPESQLVFLDAFVLKNGYGNWLADRIRSVKPKNPPLAKANSQKWSTVHAEYIFYDSAIKPVQPILPSNNSMHIFSDWGVVTYGGGQQLKKGNTFLSFKSGALNGEAVSDIVNYKLLSHFIKGWENFNAGHEHPDQNSFVFAPNGRYFITEALYSNKLTHLNNVLAFAPAKSKCNQPWEGQVGECSKWLAYKEVLPVPRGKVVAAAETNGFVFMAGEAVHAYRSELGLQSVQRSLILLHPEVLLVLDTIILNENSNLNRASAFFNNVLHPFHPYRQAGYQGAQVIYPEGPYAFFWLQPNGQSPTAQLQTQTDETNPKKKSSYYVNVTFSLNKDAPTQIAFVLVGPNVRVPKVNFLKLTSSQFSQIQIVINEVKYAVTFSSLLASVQQRMKYLGFGGFALVKRGSAVTYLGVEKPSDDLNYCDVKDDVSAQIFVRNLVSSAKLNNKIIYDEKIEENPRPIFNNNISVIYLMLFASYCLKVFRQRSSFCWKVTLASLLVYMLYWYFSTCWECKKTNSKFLCSKNQQVEKPNEYFSPTIVVVSLPNSGSEMLRLIFENSTSFVYITSNDVIIPGTSDNPTLFDPCWWPKESFLSRAGWFASISSEPLLFLNNQASSPAIERARRMFRSRGKNDRFVLNLNTGFWNSKLSWLQNAIGPSFRGIIVVRDPRSWIHSLIRTYESTQISDKQERLRESLLKNFSCVSPSLLPNEFKILTAPNLVERLSQLWTASVTNMISNGRYVQIVRVEDVIAHPQFTSIAIMKRMGLTLSLTEINHLTRFVRSGHFSFPHEPANVLSEFGVNSWKDSLSPVHVAVIERVCGRLMNALDYL